MTVSRTQKERVQRLLNEVGGYSLRIDGLDGPQTWNALEDYLNRNREPNTSNTALIDPEAFRTFAPNALPGTYEALEAAAQKWNIRGLVLVHWLGQMYVESQGFSTLSENLNYSVDGLKRTFGRHRISEAECLRYGRTANKPADQKAIANAVYGGQWGLENLGNRLDHPNDGWDFRGSGFKQITGYANTVASGYSAVQLRSDVHVAADAAAWYFMKWRPKCAQAASNDNVEEVTKAVNGGLNGLEERKTQTRRARSVIRNP